MTFYFRPYLYGPALIHKTRLLHTLVLTGWIPLFVLPLMLYGAPRSTSESVLLLVCLLPSAFSILGIPAALFSGGVLTLLRPRLELANGRATFLLCKKRIVFTLLIERIRSVCFDRKEGKLRIGAEPDAFAIPSTKKKPDPSPEVYYEIMTGFIGNEKNVLALLNFLAQHTAATITPVLAATQPEAGGRLAPKRLFYLAAGIMYLIWLYGLLRF